MIGPGYSLAQFLLSGENFLFFLPEIRNARNPAKRLDK